MDDFGKILEGLGYRKVKSSYDGFFATYYGKYCGYEAFQKFVHLVYKIAGLLMVVEDGRGYFGSHLSFCVDFAL